LADHVPASIFACPSTFPHLLRNKFVPQDSRVSEVNLFELTAQKVIIASA
jgi:hypothetical protein